MAKCFECGNYSDQPCKSWCRTKMHLAQPSAETVAEVRAASPLMKLPRLPPKPALGEGDVHGEGIQAVIDAVHRDLDVEQWLPHYATLSLSGKRGEVISQTYKSYCRFDIRSIDARDTSIVEGYRTEVSGMFVGNLNQFSGAPYPSSEVSADLSLLTTGRSRFDMCEPFICITVQVLFAEDCDWTMRLLGYGFKRASDTEEMMRTRAIAAWKADQLRGWHDVTDEDRKRLDEMAERM